MSEVCLTDLRCCDLIQGTGHRPAPDEYECVGHVCVTRSGKVDYHEMFRDVLNRHKAKKNLTLFIKKNS